MKGELATESDDNVSPGLPEWAKRPFNDFLDHQDDLARVLHLSMAGISMLRGRYEAVKMLAEWDGKLEDEKERLDGAAKERDLAQSELNRGFPLLHEQATVALWSALEALVRTFCATWLANKPATIRQKPISELRVKLAEYEALDVQDRCLMIIDLIDRETSGPLKYGVGRFESLLAAIGLGGSVDDATRKALFELSSVRNVLVHRRGIVDRKLVDSCPWLKVNLGDKLAVLHPAWRSYHAAVGTYVVELIQRVRVACGLRRRSTSNEQSTQDGGQNSAEEGTANDTT